MGLDVVGGRVAAGLGQPALAAGVVYDDGRAPPGELQGIQPAKAPPCSGHDHNLPGKVDHEFFLSSVLAADRRGREATSIIRASAPTACLANGASLSRALSRAAANRSGGLALRITRSPTRSSPAWCGA